VRWLAFLLLAEFAFGADSYLFTSFRKNGETGVYFALSEDGRNWAPLKSNQPWIKPEHPGMLMRDPFLTRGPDGTWHLLWTWGWTRQETGGGLKIGYSSSKDLLQWSPQREIKVLENEPTAKNAWAPEAAWDARQRQWVIFWSTTIPKAGETGYDHRLYSMTTRDWQTFSPAKLWFDPGFSSIDATLVPRDNQWMMVFKDERDKPVKKNLRLAFAATPAGPWSGITEPFTQSWVEGPTVAKIGEDWLIYFDRYREHRYGALRTRDWKTFDDVPVSFPDDHRHGTVVKISDGEARALKSVAAETRATNVILITADGLRWQDLFNGSDPTLSKGAPKQERAALMPFFWGQVASRGVILGNVNRNSSVRVTNGFRVSYPGYSEILTGRSQDEAIRGNDKIQNPTQTVLEFLREKLRLSQRQVALFGSWDTFRFIGESKPGSIFINCGFEPDDGSPRMKELTLLQNQALTPSTSVRHDYVTLNMALDYMKREKPRVTYISLGETDDWAHDRRYDRVLATINYFDQALREIFAFVDSTPEYGGKTAIVITSDHGRGGTPDDWHSHGAKVAGADQIWLAMVGPGIPARGEVSNSEPAFQRDVAPTILTLLGIDPAEYKGVIGKPIRISEAGSGSGVRQASLSTGR
jgi:hypothetical protein